MKTQRLTIGLLLPICAASFSVSLASQGGSVPQAQKVEIGTVTKSPSFITVDKANPVSTANYQEWVRVALNMRSEDGLHVYRTHTDDLGFLHHRYQQQYNNIPVEGGEYLEHTKNGIVVSTNGTYYPNINADINPSVTEDKALQSALKHIGGQKYMWEDMVSVNYFRKHYNDPARDYYPHGSLVMAPVNGDYAKADFRLCWKFDVWAVTPMKREYVFVDAKTGEVIFFLNRIHTSDTPGTANTLYSGTQNIVCNNAGSNFTLSQSAPVLIQTKNLNYGTSVGSAVDFTNATANWTQGAPDQCATDAHWGLEGVYDFYKNTPLINRNSIDGVGGSIDGYIHYSTNYANAMWTGQEMVFGDGDGFQFTYMEGLDVMGHEVSHGVTQHTCALQYSGESGALNEAFSDCMGTSVEWYWRPTNKDWIIGAEITPSGLGIRSMKSPKNNNQPDCYNGTYWSLADPHIGSGVMNYWYYLGIAGGSGTNDLFHPYAVNGIGMTKMQAIVYRAWDIYLTSTSNFADTRTATESACMDLYPTGCTDLATIQEAWYAVGVGGVPTNSSLSLGFTANPSVTCNSLSPVTFKNATVGATTYAWDFGDGGTSSLQNPAHTYTASGSYTVKLVCTQTGGCGNATDSLTQVNYISVLSNTASTQAPYAEGFENSTFPCADCYLSTSSGSAPQWDRTTTAFYTGVASMKLDNFGSSSGVMDEFITPSIDMSIVTSPKMTFKLAHAQRNVSDADKLIVYTSTNCGSSWTLRYSKSGNAIATTSVSATSFTPSSQSEWRQETVNIGNVNGQADVRFKFQFSSVGNGNNIFIDDINITGTLGVEEEYANGFDLAVSPNPFSDNAVISFNLLGKYQVSASVYDIVGREISSIYSKEELSSGTHTIPLSCSALNSGIYFVRLIVNGYSVTKKVVVQ